MSLIAVATLALQLAAPQGGVGHVIDLAEAERLAAAHQPRLRAAAAEREAARARAAQARAWLLPQLRATATYSRSTDNYTAQPGALPTSLADPASSAPQSLATYDYFSFGLTASQALFDLASWQQYRGAVAGAEAQVEAERETALQVEAQVAAAWFQARARRSLVEIAREELANRARHRGDVERLVAAGARPSIDLAQARADEAGAAAQRALAESDYRMARAQLAFAIGLDGAHGGEPAGDGFDVDGGWPRAVAGEEAPLDSQLDEALRARPALRAAERRLEAQRSVVRAQRAGYAPSLSAVVRLSDAGFELQHMAWNASAGLALSWSLFDGLRTAAQVREAEAATAALAAQQDTLRHQLRLEILQARSGAQAAVAALAAQEVALAHSRLRVRLAEERYRAGGGSAIEVADAQLGLTTAAARKVQSELLLASARAQLLFALGRHLDGAERPAGPARQ